MPSREIETVEKAEPVLQKRVRSVRFGAGGGSPQTAKQQRHEEEDSPLARLRTKNHCAHKHPIQKKPPMHPRGGTPPKLTGCKPLGLALVCKKIVKTPPSSESANDESGDARQCSIGDLSLSVIVVSDRSCGAPARSSELGTFRAGMASRHTPQIGSRSSPTPERSSERPPDRHISPCRASPKKTLHYPPGNRHY